MQRFSSSSKGCIAHAGKRRLNQIPAPNRRAWVGANQLVVSRCFTSPEPQREKKLDLQAAHEERVKLARAAKEERQKMHHQRVQATRRDKSMEKLQNLRKQAARSIPYWLGNELRCFDLTMEALNLSSPPDKVKEARDGIFEEYRQIFLDSIPSFFQQITSPNTSSTITNSLDQLVAAGFSDLKFAKNYRKIVEYQANFQMYSKRAIRKAKQLNERRERLGNLEQALLEMESSQKKEETTEPPAPTAPTSSELVSQVLAIVSNWLGSGSEVPGQGLPVSISSSKEERRLEKQKRLISKAKEAVESTALQLQELREERDSFEPLISEEEYNKATQVVNRVMEDICKEFGAHINHRHAHMIEQYQTLDAQTDLTKPHEWYLFARLDRRKIIYHGGPTNSGKTYSALQRLKEAQKGLYLGPLRLLAAEVYERLTSEGIYTNLFTGQEQREIPFATHTSATVEMAPTQEEFDVVVIDEIQMIADPFRGFAWSRALMGLRCKEIHVCGGMEAKAIVEKIADVCGDDFELKTYGRFSELEVASRSLASQPNMTGSYKAVQPGDCVVAFSRGDIFAIKREIENSTNFKCCVVYGSLPPETRTDQARRFNDPNSGYDILVASDAIGMGLNLNIRRIIFNSLFKSNGETIIKLDHSSVKQIAGRAGRRNSPYPVGEVTCRDPLDMAYLTKCMSTEIHPIQKAGLLPTSVHIELFSNALQKYRLSKDHEDLNKILRRFNDMATLKGDFFLCRQTPMRVIARWLTDLSLPISEKFTLCMAPVSTNCERGMTTLRKFAAKHAAGEASGLRRNMIPKPPKSFDELAQLCSVHNELELFLWLHNRFPGNVVEQQTALALKERAISFINQGLAETENLSLDHCYIKRDGRIRDMWKKNQRDEAISNLEDYLGRSDLSDI